MRQKHKLPDFNFQFVFTVNQYLTSQKIRTTLFVFVFAVGAFNSLAQWSDTKNLFTDSLHMPVSRANWIQTNSIIVQSFPDMGYFVIWEDKRDYATQKTDIYAQKYDKDGLRLWSENGVVVASGPDEQLFSYMGSPFGADYRNYSFACTDSAGGFYITWADDNSVNTKSTVKSRVCVQHVKADGSLVFPKLGQIIREASANDPSEYVNPQLVPDGRKGFFISYVRTVVNHIELHCYRDEGGALKHYGGGVMNRYAVEVKTGSPCGQQTLVEEKRPNILDYFIWPDHYNGCNIVMSMTVNAAFDGSLLGFNRLCRVKKDITTTVNRRISDIASYRTEKRFYKKDSVVALFTLTKFTNTVSCRSADLQTIYQVPSTYIENFGEGFKSIATPAYDFNFSKGVTIPTTGNVNVDVFATLKRDLRTSITNPTVIVLSGISEKYDAIPYQLASDDNPWRAIRTEPPAGIKLDRVNNLKDTIFTSSKFHHDFAFRSSGDKVYATAAITLPSENVKTIFLQQLKLEKVAADSFALRVNTPSEKGIMIGKEIYSGFSGTTILYDQPQIQTDAKGSAVFYITEKSQPIRVSPIVNATQLSWGAMGKPIGTGVYKNARYQPEQPYLIIDSKNGTGLISWTDARLSGLNSGMDIYMRHLDSLSTSASPPYKMVNTLPKNAVASSPISYMVGSSKHFSMFESSNNNTDASTPLLEIQDVENLGTVEVNVYQHAGPIRKHQDSAYLDRNYLVKVEQKPAGTSPIGVRLFFTETEFKALQDADKRIVSPGYLSVIKQPSTSSTPPAKYEPVTGEEEIVPTRWKAVPGGYYIEFAVTSFSNFFIKKNSKPSTIIKGPEPDPDPEPDPPVVSTLNDFESTIAIYPNPAQLHLYISGARPHDQFEIYDMAGKILLHQTSEQVIGTDQLKPGMYFLKIKRGSETQVLRFVKS
jgi:hypothetical protein